MGAACNDLCIQGIRGNGDLSVHEVSAGFSKSRDLQPLDPLDSLGCFGILCFFGGRSDALYAKTAIVVSSVCDMLPLDTFGTLATYIFDVLQWEFQDPKMDVLYHIRPYAVGIFPYIGLI